MSATIRTLIREVPTARENQLLAALPEDESQRLAVDLEPIYLNFNQVLYEYDEPIRYVYFPQSAVVSMLAVLEDGTTVEVGMVGNSGMVGISAILGAHRAPNWTVVQIEGCALRMGADAFKDWFAQPCAFGSLLTRFYRALITQFCQRAVCNCRHMIMQRLCTWLLMTRDSYGADELPLTQDLISRRLGSRRASVTGAYNRLQKMGVLYYGRGHVRILDGAQLEGLACECYQIIKREADHVFFP